MAEIRKRRIFHNFNSPRRPTSPGSMDAPEANRCSAADSAGSRKCRGADQAWCRHGRNAPSYARMVRAWPSARRAVSLPQHWSLFGAWHSWRRARRRHRQPSGRDLSKRQDGRGVWHRRRPRRPQGKLATFRRASGPGRGADLRISSGNFRCAAEFPYPQADHQRHVGGCSRGGSRGIFRHAPYGAQRARAESRRFRRPGNVTNKNSREPNTLTKPGAKLVATSGSRVGRSPSRTATCTASASLA